MLFMMLKIIGDNKNMLKDVTDTILLMFKNIEFFYSNKDPGEMFWTALFWVMRKLINFLG